MNINRQMAVYITTSRKAKVYQAAPQSLQELFKRLEVSQPIPYAIRDYKKLPKAQQDDLKDVGGYVLGELDGGRRRAGMVLSRSGAVLDADNIPSGGTDDFILRVKALGVCACVYSTAKHCPEKPRLRVVIPFAEDILAEQYQPTARLLCKLIQPDMSWFDPTTAQAERMMYYPAHCQDVDPVYEAIDGPLLDAPTLLAQHLPDWQDPTAWPQFPSDQKRLDQALRKAQQQDPTGKKGVVGAFCRAYDVPAAMDKYLPGVYTETATGGRCTFTGGSTWGGAVLYDGGKFLYSYHATDPAGGKLVNAFDLVRLHKFGALDDDAEGAPKGNTLPSFRAMAELAQQDPAVKDELAREALDSAKVDFQDEAAALELAHYTKDQFDLDALRAALKTIGTQVRRNLITGKLEIVNMPAAYSEESAANILPVLLWDLMKPFQIKGASITAIQKGLAALADENRYNPVLDMLQGTTWDGESRFPVLLGILGIDSGGFYALLVRKWLIQCVALVHNTYRHQEAAEGVLVLQGPQGIGKTTFFRRLAIKSEWMAEGVTLDMKNKDDIIMATSVWITELGELESTLKKEQSNLKAFITKKVDRIRAPYAAESEDRPRRTSFGATVNQAQFLRDETGDRRFFVVPLSRVDADKLWNLPDEWFIQLWAEVNLWWELDPQGFRLSAEDREHLNELNREHREPLPGEEEIRLALDWGLPQEQWRKLTAAEIKDWLFRGACIDVRQIGRALTRLAQEDKRIVVARIAGVNHYSLPSRGDFDDV